MAAPTRLQSGRGAGRIDVNSAPARRYVQFLQQTQASRAADFGRAIGRPLQVNKRMQHALNAIVTELTPEEEDFDVETALRVSSRTRIAVGEPADLVTVSDELSKRGELQRVGGGAYLADLIDMVPTAANAGYYAEIVAEKAILRRLVEAGTRIVQYGYAGADGQDVAEVVDRAQAEVYEVTEKRTAEDYVPLEDLLQPTMDEIDAIASRGGDAQGIPTGFADLDELV